MKSIPTLVASSTVGVAATGLVFGRPQLSTPVRPSSNKRKATAYDIDYGDLLPLRSRPATSSTATTPIREEGLRASPRANSIPSESRLPSNGSSSHGNQTGRVVHSTLTARRVEATSLQDNGIERRRDSVSSRGSWYKRLSIIQVSQQNSPRSSVGPDSPSLTFSHGSAAPILPTTGSPTPLPPNKLVKRSTSNRLPNGEIIVRTESRSQLPTLRRPATSHQRSVTLQQQYIREERQSIKRTPQPHSSPNRETDRVIIGSPHSPSRRVLWKLYFESRPTKLIKERPSAMSSDGSVDAFYPTSRRIVLPESSMPPTLLKPTMIGESDANEMPTWMERFPANNAEVENTLTSTDNESIPITQAPHERPHKRPHRSLSMHFSSPTTWISRSGSLRTSKGGGNVKNIGKRNASAPVSSMPSRATASAHSVYNAFPKGIMGPAIYQDRNWSCDENHDLRDVLAVSDHQSPTDTNSSPLPPLSRLSSFNLDLSRLGLSSPSSSAPCRTPTSPISSSNLILPSDMPTNKKSQIKPSPTVVIHQKRSRRAIELTGSNRASTLVESDGENRGFTSGEEDDMDFNSDTVFDSYRTGTVGSIRARNIPLDLMFDESPPGNGYKSKGPNIRERPMSAAFRDTSNRIVEEDEGNVTPIRHRRSSDGDRFNTPVRDRIEEPLDDVIRSSPPSFCLTTREFARISLEDEDEDEDWTKDDENEPISNPLSPPSSSANSRRISPAIRTALADVTKSGSSSGNAGPVDDRPRSLFDWSEPFAIEKSDVTGNFPRPKTVHGKQAMDGRGSRAAGRKGPTALHIRSQSVPVVPDINGHRGHTKLAPKFGTWGLGGKGANEDWDNDFEFDGLDVEDTENGTESMSSSAMIVPPAIQASQANVVGHVGQIREVCLLVEDLKRLRGLAREKGILDGSSAGLWREAEGIIALAIPDEDEETISPQPPVSLSFVDEVVNDRFRDGGFDIDELNGTTEPSKSRNRLEQADVQTYDDNNTRRRSVLSPGDDIFGAVADSPQQLQEDLGQSVKSGHQSHSKGSDVARSVMEHIHQHRKTLEPAKSRTEGESAKMPFDTTSLRDLVNRASALTRVLSELIRKADDSTQSSHHSTQKENDSSPAFTRVFADPLTSPSKNLPRSHSNNSILRGSMDASPTGALGKRIHIMTVV